MRTRIWIRAMLALGCVAATSGAEPYTHEVVANVPIAPADPTGVAVNEQTNTIYVGLWHEGTVKVIDGTTHALIATVPVGRGPADLDIDTFTGRVYVMNNTSGTVSVIDGSTNTVLTTIDPPGHPYSAVADPASRRLYVTSAAAIVEIDMDTNVVVGSIPLPTTWQRWQIALDSARDKLYVSDPLTASIFVVDLVGRSVTATIPVGPNPTGVGVDSVANRIYVTDREGTISIIDGSTASVIKTLPLRGSGGFVEIHRTLGLVYVASGGGIAVLDTGTDDITTIATGSAYPHFFLAVDRTRDRIYSTSSGGGMSVLQRVKVVAPEETLELLLQDVLDLNIANGISNALDSKLDAALDALTDTVNGNDDAAINMLQAFINAVSAQAGNQIPEADADALVADALTIIDLLEAS